MARLKRMAVLALLFALIALGGRANADPPAPQNEGARKVYMSRRSFELPATLDGLDLASLQALKLFRRAGSGPWLPVATSEPSRPSFPCTVEEDGEYAYMVVA